MNEMIKLIDDLRECSRNRYEGRDTTNAIICNIESEITLMTSGRGSLQNWCQVVLLALDGAWRAGYSSKEVWEALVARQSRNIEDYS